MGNTVSRNIVQYHANTGCGTTSFFGRIGKINPFKEVLKKSNFLTLIKNARELSLGKNKSLSNADIESCMKFAQTVLYGGNINEAYSGTRINIYRNLKTKSSMTLHPDPDCATQDIVRAHY